MTSTSVEMIRDDESVTVVTSRRVKPGCEAAFERWLEGIGNAAAQFPGLIGRRITRPADHDHPEYVTVFKFDSYPHLRAWTESAERRSWLEQVRPLVLDEFKRLCSPGSSAGSRCRRCLTYRRRRATRWRRSRCSSSIRCRSGSAPAWVRGSHRYPHRCAACRSAP